MLIETRYSLSLSFFIHSFILSALIILARMLCIIVYIILAGAIVYLRDAGGEKGTRARLVAASFFSSSCRGREREKAMCPTSPARTLIIEADVVWKKSRLVNRRHLLYTPSVRVGEKALHPSRPSTQVFPRRGELCEIASPGAAYS